jgi:hypothetical protein
MDEETVTRVVLVAGAYAFNAERISGGVTTGVGMQNGTVSGERGGGDTARSIAPRRTSNNDRTSPDCAAIFFVSKVSVGEGSSFLA